ncbi:hypothetical protein BGZ73_007065 [Actinomortierella ambigua]|nr:hypothetical protein BGZ73_007065 [Actinomortierella ambigua]
MLIKTIVLYSACAFAEYAAVSRGRFLGRDTTKSGSAPIDIYQDPVNHVTAAASILRGLAVEVEYFPQEDSPAELAKKLGEWSYALSSSPALERKGRSVGRTIAFDGDRNELDSVISHAIKDLPHGQWAGRELAQMIPKHVTDADLTQWSLLLQVIYKADDDSAVMVYLYELGLKIQPHQTSGDIVIPRQKLLLNQRTFALKAKDVESKAEEYAMSYGVTLVPDFEWFFESSEDSLEVRHPCHRGGPRRLNAQGIEPWF